MAFVPPQEDKSHIEELKKTLYSRNAPDVRTKRKLRFTDSASEVRTSWDKETSPEEEESIETELNETYEERRSMSFFTKLFIGSMIFFVAAVGIGAFLFFKGANFISADNIDITVSGPVSISGGEPITFDIRVTNNNNVALQLTDLSVDFPDGTTNPADPTQELRNFRELIGDIEPKDSASKSVTAIIFGEENLQKSIVMTVTYKIKGSTAVFTKSSSYDVLINSSPISLSVDSFKEITAGQEFDTTVTLKSNSQETLKSVLLRAQYPFGFTFVSSDMKPLSDNMTWRIGDIPAGGEKVIKVRGKLMGEDSETRVFRFVTGAQSGSNPNVIGTEYVTAQHDIHIQKPFMSVAIAIDNNDSNEDYVTQFGQAKRVKITWFNNLSTAVSNGQIKVKLSGTAYNKNSIQPESGNFLSGSDEIVWNQQTTSDLQSIGGGDSGSVSFMVTPQDSSSGQSLTNPLLNVDVSFSGNRTQESGVSGSLSSTARRSIRISTIPTLSGRVVRTIGPFTNTGPIPPRAELDTTYTVVWAVDNTVNPLSNAQVRATLPPYVSWMDKINPSNERVTYDQNTNTVIWDVGNVGTHTLGTNRRREVMFQVSLRPNITQVDQSPILVNQATLTATDTFTKTQLQSVQEVLTTRFSTDPSFKDGQGTVVR